MKDYAVRLKLIPLCKKLAAIVTWISPLFAHCITKCIIGDWGDRILEAIKVKIMKDEEQKIQIRAKKTEQ